MKVQRILMHRRKSTLLPLFRRARDVCRCNRSYTKRTGSSDEIPWQRVGCEWETWDEWSYSVHSYWCQVHRVARDRITDEESPSSACWKRYPVVEFYQSFSSVFPALCTLRYDRIISFHLSTQANSPRWVGTFDVFPVTGRGHNRASIRPRMLWAFQSCCKWSPHSTPWKDVSEHCRSGVLWAPSDRGKAARVGSRRVWLWAALYSCAW